MRHVSNTKKSVHWIALAAVLLQCAAFAFPPLGQTLKHEQDVDERILVPGPDPTPLNLTLVGNLPYEVVSSDIWGYAAPDGREYALVGLQSGVSIVEILRSGQLVERGFIGGPSSKWRDIKTLGHYAYAVVDESGGGMQIIDLSPLPAAPQLVATYEEFSLAHNLYIDTDRDLLFVVGTRLGNGGMRIYDLADPMAPVYLARWDTTYTHDVHVHDTTAYLFNAENGVTLVDVSDPSDPAITERITYNGMGYTHSGWVSDDGNVLAVCDEFDELTGGFEYTRVLFFTRSGPGDLFRRSHTYIGPNRAVDHNVFFWGEYAVLSNYTFGVTLIHMADLSDLHMHGNYDTFPEDDDTKFAGVWGVYPYLPSGRIIASDINSGLYVLQVDHDHDGISDRGETGTGIFVDALDSGTDPLNSDTDGDHVGDGYEVKVGTDPNVVDTDGDGFDDRIELALGMNPLDHDPASAVPGPNGGAWAALLVAAFTACAVWRRRSTSVSARQPK